MNIDLEQVVSRQVDRYVGLKFHEELGMSESEYRQSLSLPEGVMQPETYRGRFDVLLVVEPRISLARQHRLAKIAEYIATDKIVNLTEIPNKPYAVWTHDGQIYRPITVEQARNQFKDDEVGSPQLEVTDFYLQHPEYFKGRGIDAAGSQYEGGYAPYLAAFHGGPRVVAYGVGSQPQLWGALSRGKEIIKLGV